MPQWTPPRPEQRATGRRKLSTVSTHSLQRAGMEDTIVQPTIFARWFYLLEKRKTTVSSEDKKSKQGTAPSTAAPTQDGKKTKNSKFTIILNALTRLLAYLLRVMPVRPLTFFQHPLISLASLSSLLAQGAIDTPVHEPNPPIPSPNSDAMICTPKSNAKEKAVRVYVMKPTWNLGGVDLAQPVSVPLQISAKDIRVRRIWIEEGITDWEGRRKKDIVEAMQKSKADGLV